MWCSCPTSVFCLQPRTLACCAPVLRCWPHSDARTNSALTAGIGRFFMRVPPLLHGTPSMRMRSKRSVHLQGKPLDPGTFILGAPGNVTTGIMENEDFGKQGKFLGLFGKGPDVEAVRNHGAGDQPNFGPESEALTKLNKSPDKVDKAPEKRPKTRNFGEFEPGIP